MTKLRTITALTALALTAGGCSTADIPGRTITVTADFENIAGMYEGNAVDVLGLQVGRIDKITPHGSYVTATLSIDKDVAVPADVIAALVSPSVVTDRHIELTPPYTGSGPTLRDGDHMPVARTRTPVEIDTLIKTIDQFAKSLAPPAPGEPGPLSSRVAFPLLDGQGDRIRQTLEGLSGALKVGVDNKDAVSTIIVKLNDLTTMLAENDAQTREFSNLTTKLTTLLARQAPGLAAVLKQINDFVANTGGVLGQHRDELTVTLNRLTATADQLRANARNLTEVVDVAPLMFQNLSNAVTPMNGGAIRLHLLTDKTLLDNETLSKFCEKILKRADGCRNSSLQDFGPDLGLTAGLLGMTDAWKK